MQIMKAIRLIDAFVLMCICAWTKDATAGSVQTRSNVPIYRHDYMYIPELQTFYKLNNNRKSWFDGKAQCDAEGAQLAIIRTNKEAELLKTFLNKVSENKLSVNVGLQDLISEGDFQTIDGEPISMVFHDWDDGEPNDAGGNEDCVLFRLNGKLNDANCADKNPFLCKKETRTIKHNVECENFDQAYKVSAPNQCIKFHKEPKTWEEAVMICKAELAHLAIINSKAEANLYVQEFAKYPVDSLKGRFDKNVLLLGFHDKFIENEFVTIEGKPLSDTGYEEWDSNQPDNDNNEDCGSMFRSGLLNDVSCNSRAMFICEKNLADVQDISLNQRIQE